MSVALVAVFGDGIQQDHPALVEIPGSTWTVTEGAPDGGPENAYENHETTVAGLIGTRLRSYKTNRMATCLTAGFVPSWLRAKAIIKAADSGARVINWSWFMAPSSEVEAAFRYARSKGVVIVASAGNSNDPLDVTWPASSPYVLAVGGIDKNFQHWTGWLFLCDKAALAGSNGGLELDFVARADNLLTTDRTGEDGYSAGDLATRSGTSYAAPQVAGVFARLFETWPAMTARTAEIILEETAIDLGDPGWDPVFGHGLVDEEAAREMAGDVIRLEDFEGPGWQ